MTPLYNLFFRFRHCGCFLSCASLDFFQSCTPKLTKSSKIILTSLFDCVYISALPLGPGIYVSQDEGKRLLLLSEKFTSRESLLA